MLIFLFFFSFYQPKILIVLNDIVWVELGSERKHVVTWTWPESNFPMFNGKNQSYMVSERVVSAISSCEMQSWVNVLLARGQTVKIVLYTCKPKHGEWFLKNCNQTMSIIWLKQTLTFPCMSWVSKTGRPETHEKQDVMHCQVISVGNSSGREGKHSSISDNLCEFISAFWEAWSIV